MNINNYLLKYAIAALVFFFTFLPLGAFNWIKYILLISSLFFILLNIKDIKMDRLSLAIVLMSLALFIASYLMFMANDNYYIESITLLQSIVFSCFTYVLVSVCIRSGIISLQSFLGVAIRGLISYSACKTLIVVLIYFNIISVDVLSTYTPDMTSLGDIGAKGFVRTISVNDFLLPFFYFFINISSIKWKNFARYLLLISIVLSFTRSIWFGFIALFLFYELIINRRIGGAVFLILIVVFAIGMISSYTDFDLITSINHRLFVEGALSSGVKLQQATLMIERLASSPIFGEGLGGYIPDYIRNERLKYGYEVANLSIVMQLGILPALLLLSFFIFSFFRIYINSNRTRFDKFVVLSLIIFLLFGFSNPVVLSSVSVILYVAVARTLDSRRNVG